MDSLQNLVRAIAEEDRRLRQLLAAFPRSSLETRTRIGSLSFKETLGHLAFWDDFTSHFFHCKIDSCSCRVPPPVDFEESSRKAMLAMSRLPFGEVLARYLEATGTLLGFLKDHWGDLSVKERNDFWVPMRHRREHRLALGEDLNEILLCGSGEESERVAASG